jgi:hypothetical protein
MNVWRRAEEILMAIRGDLEQDPSAWEEAARSTENLKRLLPELPMFQDFRSCKPSQSYKPSQTVDWRIAELKADLDQLQFGLMKRDRENAVGSALSAMRNVQELGRKA